MSLFYPKRRGNKETVISRYIAGTKGNTLKSSTGIENILPTLTIPTCTASKCHDFTQVYGRFVKFVPWLPRLTICISFKYYLNTKSIQVLIHTSQLTVLCLTFLSMEHPDIQLLPAFPYTHLLLVAVVILDQFLHPITNKFK